MSKLNYIIDMSQYKDPGFVHLSNLDNSKFPPSGTLSALNEHTECIFLPYTANNIENNTNIVVTFCCT